MIREYFKLLMTQASAHAKEMGYLKESIAFEARAHRHWKFWRPHFEITHQLILSQIESRKDTGDVWIIGSGSLFETPWQSLLAKGLHLHLVDIHHPRSVRSRVARNKNMKLVPFDVTGFTGLKDLEKILLKIPNPLPLPVAPNDFVISSNLWSQLPIAPLAFLSRNTEITEDEKVEWAYRLQRQHEKWLKSLGCDGILFSDFEIHLLDPEKNLVEIQEQPCRPKLPLIKSWDWKWDENQIRKVEAYSISRKTP